MPNREPITAAPYLVRAYVEHVKPHTGGKLATWGPEWVRGTHVFGRQLIWAGAAVVVASWWHGDLGWRLTLGSMGLFTAAVGAWHRIYAQAICELALERSQRNLEG